MKAGCYLSLAMLTGLVLGYHWFLEFYVDPPAVWIASGVMGLLSWFCIGSLWNGLSLGGTIAALRNGRDGVTPQDGTLSAVEGEIHPYAEPIIAPMSGDPCVIYEYEISRTVSGDDGPRNITDFSGIGMAACEIRTEHQTIALYGFPEMEEFASEHCGYGSRARAQDYVRETEWEDFSGVKVVLGISQMLGALTSNGESIKRDFRMVGPSSCPWLEPPDEDAAARTIRRQRDDYAPRVHEKRIRVGQRVLAIGKYDAATESFGTYGGTTFQRVRLLKGPLNEALQRAQRSRRSYLLGGLIALVVIHAISAGVFWAYCHSRETQTRWKRALRDAVMAGDIAGIDHQLERGLNIDAPVDDDLRSVLHIVEDPAIARHLIARGANPNALNRKEYTPLMEAVLQDRVEIMKVLIDARADLNHVSPEYQSTALILADSQGHQAAAELLRKAGAADEVVTAANGSPIDESHGAFRACVDYIAAISASDLESLQELSAEARRRHLDSIDWDLWRNTRPREPQLDQGFVSNPHATLQISGETASGRATTWVVQLIAENGEWRIRRENWPNE